MNEEQLQDILSKRRNIPPAHGIRVPFETMQSFIAALFSAAGLRDEDARLMGQILTGNDLRCVFSHGTSASHQYLHHLREGGINPRPNIKVVHEAAGALVLDGDGGLGYLPCWHGSEQIIAKAKECGSAVLTTRNHHHFGGQLHATSRRRRMHRFGRLQPPQHPRTGQTHPRYYLLFTVEHRRTYRRAAAAYSRHGRRHPWLQRRAVRQ